MARAFLGFWLGIAVVVLTAAAFQLSPVDVEQNNRLATHDAMHATVYAYLWSTPTQEWYVTPSPSATFYNATNTYTPAASPTRMLPTPTFVPTSSAPTATTVPLATPIPTTPTVTPLPPMVMAGNVSGVSLWVRECPAKSCDILARVQTGEFVAIDTRVTVIADGYEFVQLWNAAGYVAFRQISPPVRYLRW